MTALSSPVQRWVDEIKKMTTPDKVVVCDGSEEERERLTKECLATGELIELNQQKLPGCYLHRSAPHNNVLLLDLLQEAKKHRLHVEPVVIAEAVLI